MAVVGKCVWITGKPGCGKTCLGDYLAQQCGWEHVDADEFQFDPDPALVKVTKLWLQSWGYFFQGKGDECPAELFQPYYQHVCDQVLKAQEAEPARNVVVSVAIPRPARDFVREKLGSNVVFIGLRMSPQRQGDRMRYKEERYFALQGKDPPEKKAADGSRFAKLEVDVDDDEAGSANIDCDDEASAIPRAREFLGLGPAAGPIDAAAAAEENWKKLAAWQPWAYHGNVEVKVSAHKGTPFYARAVRQFLVGTPEKDGAAKRPYGKVTISGLGPAISVVAAVATAMQKEGLAEVSKISTDSVAFGPRASAPQLKIELTRRVE